MNVGYVCLSKDDDKRNYVSIENQKLIIRQFTAKCNLRIDRWYEDDGVSGYQFNRPGLNQLLDDLDHIERVFVKDLSRIGRHNARVLLLLEDFKERQKELVVIDTNYNSETDDDDTIGILTWYNEKYVKDISRKIKSAIEARQKAGILMTKPPFGYKRNEKDKTKLEIIPEEASYVKMVYDLYLKGSGYRKIANYLTEHQIPTPSMIRHERELAERKISKRTAATAWSDFMVKSILDNDFYIGTLRLRKRARSTVHGKDKRIPKEEQYIFENHHPAIIDHDAFSLIQDIKRKRVKSNYRGSHKHTATIPIGTPDSPSTKWIDSEIPNPFGSCLFCKDCRSRLTPIKRTTTARERKYYICTTYNTKGKRYCEKSHLIEENTLMEDVIAYMKLCRNSLCEVIATYDMEDFNSEKRTVEEKCSEIQKQMEERKAQLKVLFTQKVKDLSNAHGNEDIVNETYDALQQDIISQIHGFEMKLQELNDTSLENEDVKEKLHNALQVVDKIIENGVLDRKDIEILIERIEVDEEGFPEIELKYGLSALIQYSPALEMNRRENEIIYQTMKLILGEERRFTSAKYLSKALTDLGFPKSKKSVLPYIGLMTAMGIVEPTDNPSKPYTIIKSNAELQEMVDKFRDRMTADHEEHGGDLHDAGNNRWYAGNGI